MTEDPTVQDPDDDRVFGDLITLLRGRAWWLRMFGYGFILAVVATILGSVYGYINFPNIVVRADVSARTESIKAQDAKLAELAAERALLRAAAEDDLRFSRMTAEPLYRRDTLLGMFWLDAETGWAVGEDGIILVTRTGGRQWEPQTSATTNTLTAVHFADAETGWAVGEGGTILVTRTGGRQWDPQTSATTNRLRAVHFADAETGWAVGAGGTILVTRTGGRQWDPQTSGTTNWLEAVHFADAETGWAVGDSGTILVTRTGGLQWDPQTSATTNGLSAVHFADAETGWAVGTDGTILVTLDGGAEWRRLRSPMKEPLYGLAFSTARSGVAVGSRGQVVALTAPADTTLEQAADEAAFRAALAALTGTPGFDAAGHLQPWDANLAKRATEQGTRDALTAAGAPRGGGDGGFWPSFDQSTAVTRIAIVALLMFLVSVFSVLYRYCLRLAAFYDARADALWIVWMEDDLDRFGELADILGPERIEFGKTRSPVDQAMELAREIARGRARRGSGGG